jgi:hypothetical protein
MPGSIAIGDLWFAAVVVSVDKTRKLSFCPIPKELRMSSRLNNAQTTNHDCWNILLSLMQTNGWVNPWCGENTTRDDDIDINSQSFATSSKKRVKMNEILTDALSQAAQSQ